MKMRAAPAIRSVPPYYDEPVYIEALARSIEQNLATLDFEPEVVLDVDAETLARQVADVAEAGEHREVVAQESADGVGLGLRLDDHEGVRHADSRIPGSVPGRR